MLGENALETSFWLCAIIGTTLFIVKTLLTIISGVDSELNILGDADGDLIEGDEISSDTAFRLLSLNSIMGFLMMFGWVGLASYKQLGASEPLSILAAITAGVLMVFVVGFIFKSARWLIANGQQFSLSQTVGLTASVYQNIPADGKGKIQISVGGQTHEVVAMSENKEAIPSFKNVEVVRVVDSDCVAVRVVQ